MFSVTKTGTWRRPSWTAIVWPTIAGVIMEARDQVLTTFFSFLEFSIAIFSWSAFCTKGPFFRLLPIAYFLFFAGLMTNRSERGLRRVLSPMAGLPHGVCAMPPTGDLASPPPCGWPGRD